MASKSRNRIVVSDLEATKFRNPATITGGGTPNTIKQSPNQVNNMLQSFAGFNQAIATLGITRAKNQAAQEAIEAKNAALAGDFDKFNGFEFAESNRVFEATVGNMKGIKTSTELSPQFDEIVDYVANQSIPVKQKYDLYDKMRSKLISEQLGDGGSDELSKTDAYKSGFLPHIAKLGEDKRLALKNRIQQEFDAGNQQQLSEYTNLVADAVTDGVFESESFDKDGNPIPGSQVIEPGKLGRPEFDSILKQAVGLNMDKREATKQIITDLGLKAAEEGRPELLEFVDEGDRKLSFDPEFNKMAKGFRDQAVTKYIQLREQAYKNQQRKMKELEENTSSAVMLKLLEDPQNPNNAEMIKQLAKAGKWKQSTVSAVKNFETSLRQNDADIVIDKTLEDDLFTKAYSGLLTRRDIMDEIVKSRNAGMGINRAIGASLITAINTYESTNKETNAFQVNLEKLEALQVDDMAMMSKGKFDFHALSRKKEMLASIVSEYKKAGRAFQMQHPDLTLNSPEAAVFFEQAAESSIVLSELGPVLRPASAKVEQPARKPEGERTPQSALDFFTAQKHNRKATVIKQRANAFRDKINEINYGR